MVSTFTMIVLSAALETTTPRRSWRRPRSASAFGTREIGLRSAGRSRRGLGRCRRCARGTCFRFGFFSETGAGTASAGASAVSASVAGASSATSTGTSGTASSAGAFGSGSASATGSGAGSSAGGSATGSSTGVSAASSSTGGSTFFGAAFFAAGFFSAAGFFAAGLRFGFSSAFGVSAATASGVSSSFFFRVVFFFSSATLSRLCFALDTHGEDARDLSLRQPQPRAVLERARRRLEAQVEQLLAPVVQRVLELVVGHVPQVSSSQRDPPPASGMIVYRYRAYFAR